MAKATIPGPTGPDMLRGIKQMRSSPPEFLAACAEKFGPVVQFPIPQATVVYLADPSDVRYVLQGNHTNYSKQTVQYQSLSLVTGFGLLTSDGDVWRRMRRMLQPAFHSQMVSRVQEAATTSVASLRDRVARRGELITTLDDLMSELSLDVVGAALFGNAFGANGKALVAAVSDALDVVVRRAQQPFRLPQWVPTVSGRQLAHALRDIDSAIDGLVRARGTNDDEGSVLALLLAARESGLITDEDVRDELVTLIVAGHETVAATLTWTWLLLTAHPEAKHAVLEEVDALAPSCWADGELTNLGFTRAVVDECLRLYPPAWVVSRRSRAFDVIGGFAIPGNATVITSPYALHREARWWPDPERFRPERFVNRTPDRSHFLPFGAGPRLCIGREMALFEAPFMVAMIARDFHVDLRPTGPIGKDFGVTLRPNRAVPVRLRLRQNRATG